MGTPQYDSTLYTDGCKSGACSAALSAPTSLTQGISFANMTKTLHGGRRHRRHRHRKTARRHRQRGGSAPYPGEFSQTLPTSMHAAAEVGKLDAAFAELPQFAGKYGMSGGARSRRGRRASRRRSTYGRKRGGGFGYTPGAASASNYMIISPADEPKAFLNPQWYTENQVVPSFQGPTNAFAQQSYNNQFNYAQRAGSRKRKASRKSRKARKGSRRH
jgi:hypothetical protein